MKLKKILCLLLAIIMIIIPQTVSLATENDIYDCLSTGIGSAEGYLSQKLTEIHNDGGVGFGSDWAIITMLRGGKTIDSDILDEYADSLTETVKGWDSNVKPTDAAKAVLAYTTMGVDATDVEGVNLISLICNSERLVNGSNELAYSLLAIYASGEDIPQDAVWSVNDIIDSLLMFQTESGGFGLFDTETPDVDMTAICVQALAPYKNEDAVATAIHNAVEFMADTISDDWNYDNNPNTTAQVLLALASLEIDVTDPANGFGNSAEENIIIALDEYRNTDGNGYLFEESVNTMATYQIMQAYDAYRKAHLEGISYWDFGTIGQVYDDITNEDESESEENEADPVDVFVTIVDNGDIVTDKNGEYVASAKVTVYDLDRNGTLTVDEALYATHEALYEGGAGEGYSTFYGDHGLSLEILWGRGTEGVSAFAGYYLNNASCWSLNDVVEDGDYLTAFNYYDTIYWSDAYSYFNKNTVSVKKGNSVKLTLYALGYDEFWNTVALPYVGAKVEILDGDGETFVTDEDGKVEIETSDLDLGTYYLVAYTDAKNIVPAVCEVTVKKKSSSGGGGGSSADEDTEESEVQDEKEDVKNTETEFGLEGKNKDITLRTVVNKGKTFADIENCKGKAEIEALSERGIINGKTEKSYEPDATMTRAEFATIIVRALGLPEKDEINFDDVKNGEWYESFVKTAYHYGIVKGVSDNMFNPQGAITTEEAVVMVERAAKLCGISTDMDSLTVQGTLAEYKDFDGISDWAVVSLGYCVKDGILGADNSISPKENVTRENIAVMVYRMLGKAKLI